MQKKFIQRLLIFIVIFVFLLLAVVLVVFVDVARLGVPRARPCRAGVVIVIDIVIIVIIITNVQLTNIDLGKQLFLQHHAAVLAKVLCPLGYRHRDTRSARAEAL